MLDEYVPEVHLEHAASARPVKYVPALHTLQTEAPAAAYVPAVQVWQTDEEVAAKIDEYLPESQGIQTGDAAAVM